MNKKTIALLSGALMLCCYLGILFTMSSKAKNDPWGGGSDACEADNVSKQITINFDNPNAANIYRKSNYQGHIPSNDLRYQTTPATLLSVMDKWYCVVHISSPQCDDFLFQYVLETGSNVVNVELPGEADFHIKVSYYETFDAPNNPHDFNKDDTGELFCIGPTTRVTWSSNVYFPSAWSGTNQTITLSPSGHFCDLDPFTINKGLLPEDYETANDFIEDLYPNN